MVFFSVKCEDRKCQSNALCKENKCVCANGYIENKGICEGIKKSQTKTIGSASLNAFPWFVM